MKASPNLIINKLIPFDDLPWSAAQKILIGSFKLESAQASKVLTHFKQRYLALNDPRWFINGTLGTDDNLVVSALCEVLGADSLSVSRNRILRIAGIKVVCEQEYHFSPGLRRGSEPGSTGVCRPALKLKLLGQKVLLDNPVQAAILSLSLLLLGGLAYAVAWGLLLYGVSVFLVFLYEPWYVTEIALSNLKVGLALLCILVGVAGICGRAISNIAGLVSSFILTKLRSALKFGASKPQMPSRSS